MDTVQAQFSLVPTNYSLQQRYIINIVEEHLRKPEEERIKDQLRYIVTGSAGTGKSTLIHSLKTLLDEKRSKDPHFFYIIASYTGLSAQNINGFTIHHSFGLPLTVPKTKAGYDKFIRNWRRGPQRSNLRKVSFILIDELSFLGNEHFHLIDQLLKEANPDKAHLPFSGKSVILLGDLFQLLPINQKALFQPAKTLHGDSYKLYCSLDTSIILKTCFRQEGNSVEQVEYRAFLERLRHRNCISEDVNLLRSRREVVLPTSEKDDFEEALRIFPFRLEVAEYNRKVLETKFEGRILRIKYPNDCYLNLAIGCKVIVTKNVPYLVRDGVTNSTVGTVESVILTYGNAQQGICNIEDVIQVNIEVTKRDRTKSTHSVIRTLCPNHQIPLALCYAVTIHKCQGIELDKAVAKLGTSEFTTNSDYIIFSRVRSLKDIMITDSFIQNNRIVTLPEVSFVETESTRLKRLQHPCFALKNVVTYLHKRNMGNFCHNGNSYKVQALQKESD